MLIANFSSFLTNIRCTFKIAIKGTINFYDNDEANRCIFYSHLLWSSPNLRFTSKQNHTDLKVKGDLWREIFYSNSLMLSNFNICENFPSSFWRIFLCVPGLFRFLLISKITQKSSNHCWYVIVSSFSPFEFFFYFLSVLKISWSSGRAAILLSTVLIFSQAN